MKKKVIGLTLALSTMLTGAGYAFWTDTLNITNTVSTGEFNVKYVSASTGGRTDANAKASSGTIDGTEWGKYVFSDSYINAHSTMTQEEKDKMKTTVSEDGKSVTAFLGNLYPGSSASLNTMTKNVGTIPAMFDYADVKISGDKNLEDSLVYWISYQILNQDGSKQPWVNHYYADGLSNYEKHLNDVLAGVRLEPDQTLLIGDEGDQLGDGYTFRLPSTVTNDNELENTKITIEIALNWKQHNADANTHTITQEDTTK